MQVRILENVWHGGRVLSEGEVHEIADEVVQDLLKSGLVEPAEGGSESATPLADGSPAAGDSQEPQEPVAPVQEQTETPTTEEAPVIVPAPEVTQIPVQEVTEPEQPAEPSTPSEPQQTTPAAPEATVQADGQPSADEIADTLNSIQ